MKEPIRFWRMTSFAVLAVALTAILSSLGMLWWALQSAQQAVSDPAEREYLAGMALVSGVLLIFALFCAGLLMIRYLSFRMRPPRPRREQTEYVDAWKIAGQRFKLDDDRDEDEDEDEDEAEDGGDAADPP